MPNLDIGNASVDSMVSTVGNYSVPSADTEGASGFGESVFYNTRWSQQYGYFLNVPDLKAALLLNSIWNVGEGFDCDANTRVILDHVSGNGKDTIEDVWFNLDVCQSICGNAYAEIIKADDKDKTLLNLKPLDPATIKEVFDESGRLIRYEQVSKTKKITKFKPDEIFHLQNNRIADGRGTSYVDALEKTILADEESFDDMKRIMHTTAIPFIIFKLKTEDTSKISAIATKVNEGRKYGNNLYLPDDENILSWEVVQVSPSDIVNSWRDDIRNRFFRAIMMPQIVPGGGGQSTESEAKTIYAAYERIVRKRQLYLEKQILKQLNIKIKFIPPATMIPNLNTDNAKDGQGAAIPNDANARSSE